MVCLSYEWRCYENSYIDMLKNREKLGTYLALTYPRGGQGDTPLYFGHTLGDVTINETTNEILDADSVRFFFVFTQNLTDPASELDYYSNRFKFALQDYLLYDYQSELIDIAFAHDDSVNQGLQAS